MNPFPTKCLKLINLYEFLKALIYEKSNFKINEFRIRIGILKKFLDDTILFIIGRAGFFFFFRINSDNKMERKKLFFRSKHIVHTFETQGKK